MDCRPIALAVAVTALLAATPLSAARPDARILDAATAARPAQLALLEKVVNIDSGTGDAAGAAKVMAVLIPELKAIGATIETVSAEAPGLGDNVVARLTGKGKGRILIIGHVDTVFPAGTVAERPFRTDGARAYGPGVSDEKGGVVQAVTALRLLHDLRETNYASIVLLIETSEETGSPGTRKLIDTLVRQADVELNVEPGDAPDAVTVWRKGSATIRLTVHGRAAHAGVAPQDGRNAAAELIHQIGTLDRFPRSGEGLTANLTTLRAGDRVNVIPDLATADINVRVRTADQFDGILSAFQAAAQQTIVPDTKVDVSTTPSFPPLPNNQATDRLAAQAQAIYADLGLALTTAGNGGASESALAAAAGTPALDGLGPVGGGFHSVREYLELSSVTPRLYLFAKLLIQLGANPPAK
ncbi:glutamate carboxypeptidase [Sphingomonas crusticola]|uniref:glutamate carboxypeptidase n=1 Tax=Sphingomonas crusticola TaxID=1697973 RepID=UPI0013C2B747|nr:glutamate carboxypeptidase [Sphingomonas crusticola]